MLDVLLEYQIRSDRSEFSIRLRVDRLGQKVSTRIALPAARRRHAGVRIPRRSRPRSPRSQLAPGRAALCESGFWHILEGTDHLLFLLCLVVPFRRLRPLILIVTSFTVGHSISLIASAFGFVPDALWFPPLIETLIAITIIYMALENIVYAATGDARERPFAAMDHRLRIWDRARLWLFIRASANLSNLPAIT